MGGEGEGGWQRYKSSCQGAELVRFFLGQTGGGGFETVYNIGYCQCRCSIRWSNVENASFYLKKICSRPVTNE